jgi:methionyl aminopeptidase
MIDYDIMREAGKKVADIHNILNNFIKPGISTEDIDIFCVKHMKQLGCISGALNYHGFPKSVCISINNTVCHGICSKNEIIKDGDIVSVDIAMSYNGFFGDSCFTYIVQSTTNLRKSIVNAAYESMWNAISYIKPGICIRELGKIMENTAKKYKFNTVRDFCGHGIGSKMHMEPQVPFYNDIYANYILQTGDCITIEPMVVEKSYKLKILSDGWTAVTADGGDSAQFEHTIIVTKNGYEVTTFNDFDRKNQKIAIKA